jgi:altronate dehydratase large subunit
LIFQGYARTNGKFGVRNHILVFPTVVCAAVVARKISEVVPGTVSVYHTHGCGHPGIEKEHMIRTMSGFCGSPNVAGVLLVGLGCELITPEIIASEIARQGQVFEIVSIQKEGGTTQAIEKGKQLAQKLLREVSYKKREPVDIAELVIGAKCGGSDAFSGLTANPALGMASDQLIAEGGTVLLSEVPEMLGAEQVLIRRAATREVATDIRRITSDMEVSILKMGVDVRGTEPSPGNIAGGITTLEEKSLGAVLKGGSTAIKQVVRYAERPTERGLVIMDGPALDAVCNTGMIAAGAQIIVFTTGRGSPLGAPVAPVIKVASNSKVYHHMQDNFDLSAGSIVDGESTLQQVGEQILEKIIAVASGEPTRSEILGHDEFGIHTIGPAI